MKTSVRKSFCAEMFLCVKVALGKVFGCQSFGVQKKTRSLCGQFFYVNFFLCSFFLCKSCFAQSFHGDCV